MLPADCVLDGEIVAALDEAGRPVSADLMFGRRRLIFVAFDALAHRGEDLRPLPLSRREAVLKRRAKCARGWIALVVGVSGHGRWLFELVAGNDLEGIVGKRLADTYALGRANWFRILNRRYSQKIGRSEPFERA